MFVRIYIFKRSAVRSFHIFLCLASTDELILKHENKKKNPQTMYMYSKNEPFEKHVPNACLFIYTYLVNFSDALNCLFTGCLITVLVFVLVDIHMFTEMYKIVVSKDLF